MSLKINRMGDTLVEQLVDLMASGKTPAGVKLPSPYVKDRFGWLHLGKSQDQQRYERNNPRVPFAGKRETKRRRLQIASGFLSLENGLEVRRGLAA